jgi:hypothetical protein
MIVIPKLQHGDEDKYSRRSIHQETPLRRLHSVNSAFSVLGDSPVET